MNSVDGTDQDLRRALAWGGQCFEYRREGCLSDNKELNGAVLYEEVVTLRQKLDRVNDILAVWTSANSTENMKQLVLDAIGD